MAQREYAIGSAWQVIEQQWVAGRDRLRADWDHAHLCQACFGRRALFSYRGVVKADRSHTLCFECYRAVVNQTRARRLTSVGAVGMPVAWGPVASKLVGDREALYAGLRLRRRRAQIAARHACEQASQAPVSLDRAS